MTATVEITAQELARAMPAGGENELAYLLGRLALWGPRFVWAILDLEATGDLGEGSRVLDLERTIAQAPAGLVLGWNDLVGLARGFTQVINGVFVGCKDAATIPRLAPGLDLAATSELSLEALDSSLWRITARDARMLAGLPGRRLAAGKGRR
ncbi:MAG TPA: hypothetical protein VFW96_16850 [Thermomicrobiales bacterium]|nr:hypothetical protein [Thermomicrobiales bacterium]